MMNNRLRLSFYLHINIDYVLSHLVRLPGPNQSSIAIVQLECVL